MSVTTLGIIGFFVILLFLFMRMPVGFAMALVGFVGFTYLVSTKGAFNVLAVDTFGTFASYTLSVVPMFILMGTLSSHSGATHGLYSVAYAWLGHRPGGLAIATFGASAGFGAICGSAVAASGAMATVALPEMIKYKYDPSLAAGSIACGGNLAVIIPPSTPLIIYGILTQQPIGKLFAAGILPGILLTILFIITVHVLCRRNPQLGPAGPAISFKKKLASLRGIVEMLILFGLVIGGLMAGWFTPTEAGGFGSGAALLIGLARRKLHWQGFTAALMETVKATAMAFVILAGAMVFNRFLAVTEIPFDLSRWIAGLEVPSVIILACMVMIYFIAGTFVDMLAFMILTIPVFFPLATSLGYNPIWFGVVLVMAAVVGEVIPPVAVTPYIVASVGGVPVEVVFKGIYPFIPAMVLCIIMLIAFPQLALFLPSLM